MLILAERFGNGSEEEIAKREKMGWLIPLETAIGTQFIVLLTGRHFIKQRAYASGIRRGQRDYIQRRACDGQVAKARSSALFVKGDV